MNITIPDYNPVTGFIYRWESDFFIAVENQNKAVHIKANKAGLLSLANHLLNLARDKIPISYHLHLDDSNSLEDGSVEVLIEKVWPKLMSSENILRFLVSYFEKTISATETPIF